MSLIVIAEQSLAILAEYLDHLAYVEAVSKSTREQARIGADVIAASMQADQIARWSLHGFGDPDHDERPLGVFAMTRSSIYGLHYLDNIKEVHQKSKLNHITAKFLKNSEKRWNKSPFVSQFGLINHDIGEMSERWSELSVRVHIIPTILEFDGIRMRPSHKVDFSFGADLAAPSHHAVLPEYFSDEAKQSLDWRAKIAIASVWNFRAKYSQFFSKKALPSKVFEELKSTVWSNCHDFIIGINSTFEEDLSGPLTELAERLFPC